MRSSLRATPVLVPFLSLLACGGGDDGGPAGDVDSGALCPNAVDLLPVDWMPVDAVSSGAVASQPAGDAAETLIDATAGGFGMSADEPFVYLAFADGALEKLSMADVESFDSDAWQVAFKRYVIRSNGGDSGPGQVEVAAVAAAGLADVTAPPESSEFGRDYWTDASCAFVADGIGGPLTAFSSWYAVADGILSPQPLVFVIRLPGGEDFALEIIDYYAPAGGGESGSYQILSKPL